MKRLFVVALFLLAACKEEQGIEEPKALVESYSYSREAGLSEKFRVKVDNQYVSVLRGNEADLAIFGASGPVDVEVQLLDGVSSDLTVRPLAKGYSSHLEGRTLHLRLATGDRVVVDMPKTGPAYQPASQVRDTLDKLFIFVNPIEGAAVRYAEIDSRTELYKAGAVYDVGELTMGDKKRIYIQGGAIVKGWMKLRDLNGITVEGCGILDASEWDNIRRTPKRNPVYNAFCNKMTFNNLTVLNEDLWTMYFVQCNNLVLNNVKVVASASHLDSGAGCENDAFDICSCENVSIQGCFGYAHDDVFCIKTDAALVSPGTVRNVSFKDCIAWNFDSGNSFEIGYGTVGTCEDVSYEDIYSVHSGRRGTSTFRRAGIAIHVAEQGIVRNVSYNNVYVEDPHEHHFFFGVFKTPYDRPEWAPGVLENISISNLNVTRRGPLHAKIIGYDATHKTSGVHFKDFFLEGRKVTNLTEADVSDSSYSDDITFE